MQNKSNIYKFFVALIIFILILLTVAPAINFWMYNETPAVEELDVQQTTDLQTTTDTTQE